MKIKTITTRDKEDKDIGKQCMKCKKFVFSYSVIYEDKIICHNCDTKGLILKSVITSSKIDIGYKQ